MPKKHTVKPNKMLKAKKTIKPKMKPKVKTKTITKTKTIVKKPAKKVVKITPREKKIHEMKRKLLAQRKALLLGALEALNELPGQTVFPDLGDQATAEIDRNFMLRIKGRERKLLKKIEEAIERINQGIFRHMR